MQQYRGLSYDRLWLGSACTYADRLCGTTWAGYLLRNYMSDLEKYIKYWVGIILFLLLAIYSRDHLYSLVDGYVSPIMYLTAFMGFYVCMCLAKGICVLQKSNYLRSLFVKMGQASFLLMGTHFMIIRGIDRIYAGYHQDISMMYEITIC